VSAVAEGADVVVHYNSSRDGAEPTAERVRSHGRDPTIVQADIRRWDDVRALDDSAFEVTGGVDLLVNNVGDIANNVGASGSSRWLRCGAPRRPTSSPRPLSSSRHPRLAT